MLLNPIQLKQELKRTRTALLQVMSEKQQLELKKSQLGKYAKRLRLKIIELKKKKLCVTTEYVQKNVALQDQVNKMKKEIKELKNSLKNILFDDNDFVVTGEVVDLTQPQTPPKSKRNKPVSLGKKVQKKLML
jgi:hypothetical protein